MEQIIILNPDDFLGTPRIWTPERNERAWEEIYRNLDTNLTTNSNGAALYVVVGIQGSGKTTFIKKNLNLFLKRSFIIDAALPAVRHRERALKIAAKNRVPVEAFWIDTPLDIALSRNRSRTLDQQVPEENIKNVYSLFEPPTLKEGFHRIHHIRNF